MKKSEMDDLMTLMRQVLANVKADQDRLAEVERKVADIEERVGVALDLLPMPAKGNSALKKINLRYP